MNNNDVKRPFPDGWRYIANVGNNESRGEVFTPRWVVDKMITDGRILPTRMVFDEQYSASFKTYKKYLCKPVFEPAIGTGNFFTTILWHRIEMVNQYTISKTNNDDKVSKTPLQLKQYQFGTIEALCNLSGVDLDVGNVQTVMWRVLGDTQAINDSQNVDYWTNRLFDEMKRADSSMTLNKDQIRTYVNQSLNNAQDNWGDFNRGSLKQQYKNHIGDDVPGWLLDTWKQILQWNLQVYNFLEDTIDQSHCCTGINVAGKRRYSLNNRMSNKVVLSWKLIPLKRREKLEQCAEIASKMIGLLSKQTQDLFGKKWASTKDEKTYQKQEVEYQKLQKELEQLKVEYYIFEREIV
jgi:hypothetical protein